MPRGVKGVEYFHVNPNRDFAQTHRLIQPDQGKVNGHTVKVVPKTSAMDVVNMFRNTAASDGAAVFFTSKDSKTTRITKVVGVLNRALGVCAFHLGNITGRVATVDKAVHGIMPKPSTATDLVTFKPHTYANLKGYTHWAPATQVSGIYGILTALQVAKWTSDLGINTTLDIARTKKRQEVLDTLKTYNPVTRRFYDPVTLREHDDPNKMKQLRDLISTKTNPWATGSGGEVCRKTSQLVSDRLYSMRDIAVKSSNAAVYLGGIAGNLPVLSIISHGALIVANAQKSAENIIALQNTKQAKISTNDEALKALATHIKQERVYQARSGLAWTGSYALSLAGNVTMMAGGGVFAVPLVAIAGVINVGVTVGTTIFDFVHARTLAKRRQANTQDYTQWKSLIPKDHQYRNAYLTMLKNKKNIGLAERYTLDRLRHGSDADRQQIVQFLRDLGLSKVTINKIQLHNNEDVALKTLQGALYTDRLNYSAKNTRHIGSVTSHILGFSYMNKARKAHQHRQVGMNAREQAVRLKELDNMTRQHRLDHRTRRANPVNDFQTRHRSFA